MNRDSGAAPSKDGMSKDGAKSAQSKDGMSKDGAKDAQSKDGMSKDGTKDAQSKEGTSGQHRGHQIGRDHRHQVGYRGRQTKDGHQDRTVQGRARAADTKPGASTASPAPRPVTPRLRRPPRRRPKSAPRS